jgi:hypothetical protein
MLIGGGMGLSGIAMFAAGALLFSPSAPKSELHPQQTADALSTVAKEKAPGEN